MLSTLQQHRGRPAATLSVKGWDDTEVNAFEPPISAEDTGTLAVLTVFSDRMASETARVEAMLRRIIGVEAQLWNSAISLRTLTDWNADRDAGWDMVVIIAREDEQLPLDVCRWLAHWLEDADSNKALVCLLGSTDGLYNENGAWAAIHSVSEAMGVAFFASGFAIEDDALAVPYCVTVANSHTSGTMHWGINE